MKRKVLPMFSKKAMQNPIESDSSSADHHDMTATTSTSSTNYSNIKDFPTVKSSSRSIINCQSLATFSHLNNVEFSPSEFEIAPIKENNQETSYEEEDSLLLELAEFLSNPSKPNNQSKLAISKPKRTLGKKLSQPSIRIKIDSNNIMRTARKRTSNITDDDLAQLLKKDNKFRRGFLQ
ncbi:unnamed protein product [Blepharisma stoltei]|uniref:Uncharacterized protein n=1 Tax=Blepharisma stoltei TaxID=1481888 RepID=A0AAU9K4D4_9CILI|nr:unnamed protein product [Blepharisma stoltei]